MSPRPPHQVQDGHEHGGACCPKDDGRRAQNGVRGLVAELPVGLNLSNHVDRGDHHGHVQQDEEPDGRRVGLKCEPRHGQQLHVSVGLGADGAAHHLGALFAALHQSAEAGLVDEAIDALAVAAPRGGRRFRADETLGRRRRRGD